MLAFRSRSSDTGSDSRNRRASITRRWTQTDSDEDQLSWIADDICTHCGGLAPHGKLHCSRKCRDADANNGIETVGSLTHDDSGVSESLSKLRYPMTLSPTVQHGSGIPKQKRSNAGRPLFTLKRQNSFSSTSSDDDAEQNSRKSIHGRNGSHSSASTGSDHNETDLTTPSPWQSGVEFENDHDFSKLEDADLQLPPAMCPSSQVLLRRSITHQHTPCFTSSSLSASQRIHASPTLTPHSHGTNKGSGFQMQFNRLPGSTNLPTPVFYSAGPSQSTSRTGFPVTKSRSDGAKETLQGNMSEPQLQPVPILPIREGLNSSLDRCRSCAYNRLSNPCTESSVCAWKQCHGLSNGLSQSPSRTYSTGSEPCACNLDSLSPCMDVGAVTPSNRPNNVAQEAKSTIASPEPLETPLRGRALHRTSHSCCSGHRRSSRASCDPCMMMHRDSSKSRFSNRTNMPAFPPYPSKNRDVIMDF